MEHPVDALVQARMGSTRLPGKVLKPLGDDTVLGRVVTRLAACRTLRRVVVATSDSPTDDALVAHCRELDVAVLRGPEEDVLARFARIARELGSADVVRVTADCPFIDPHTVDRAVSLHLEGGADYTSNAHPRRYPVGLAVEVLRMAALAESDREAEHPEEREHVTPFVIRRPERYALVNFEPPEALCRPEYRITLDTPEDYRLIQELDACVDHDALVPSRRIVELLDEHPELVAINAHIVQKKLSL